MYLLNLDDTKLKLNVVGVGMSNVIGIVMHDIVVVKQLLSLVLGQPNFIIYAFSITQTELNSGSKYIYIIFNLPYLLIFKLMFSFFFCRWKVKWHWLE